MGTDLYWIADGGNWNEGEHWSLEDNGESTGAHVPTSEDNVYFTASSFQSENQVVTVPSGSFHTGIITSGCKNFTLDIVDTLTCNYEWTINNNSIINGRFKLNNVAVWNGNGIVEELYCMPYVTIKGSNTITNLILDTDGNSPSAAFYFDLHTNQTVQTFNIVNTSISSQAHIKIQPLLFVTISHSPGSVTTYGEPVTLTWSSTGADMCSIDNGIGVVAISGSTIVYPMTGTTYTITASGYGLTATDSTSMYALASTYSDSNVSYMSVLPVSGSYYIIPPTFSGLSEYTFDTDLPKPLTISCAASKYYTLDGSIPTSASSLYSTPISILPEYFTGSGIQTLIVKAVGYDSTVGDYSAVATSITYKKVPFGVAIIVNRTDTLIEAIVSEERGSLVTTAMPVSGSYDEVIIVQETYTDDPTVTTATPVSGSYDEVVIVQEDYTDGNVSMSVLPISGAYWKVIVEG